MISLDQLRSLAPLRLVLQILLVPSEGAFLHDPGGRGQVGVIQETFDIADASFEFADRKPGTLLLAGSGGVLFPSRGRFLVGGFVVWMEAT